MTISRTSVAWLTGLILGLAMIAMAENTIDEIKYRQCVNQVAHQAYVEADVGDTFDAGFDAGLYAAKVCSE